MVDNEESFIVLKFASIPSITSSISGALRTETQSNESIVNSTAQSELFHQLESYGNVALAWKQTAILQGVPEISSIFNVQITKLQT